MNLKFHYFLNGPPESIRPIIWIIVSNKIPLERDENGDIIFNDQLKRIVISNMRGNVVFERKILAIADLRKDTLTPDELKQLMRFLNNGV